MEYQRIEGEFPRLSRCAVTLGKFDGIHRGHRRLVEKILEQKERGALAVLFAFDISSQTILSRQERCLLLEEMGVDVFLECPLDTEMKHMKAENFVKEILVGRLHTCFVAVGEDYRFGYERKGTPKLLCELGEKYGFQVEIIPREMEGRRKVSSTYIREELSRGSMERFFALMGMHFPVCGTVEHGQGLGHKKLFPTTNLIPAKEKLMPPNGVYITRSYFGDRCFQGITNVGYKPTVGERFLGVETYLFDCGEDLYGQFCKVEFLHYLRPEEKFSSLEALKAQIEKDILSGRAYFEAENILREIRKTEIKNN